MPTTTTPSTLNTDEHVLVSVTDSYSVGIRVRAYDESDQTTPVCSTRRMYAEDGVKRVEEASTPTIRESVSVESLEDICVFIARTDEGYRIEVNEELGHGLSRVLFVAELTDRELGLVSPETA